MSLVVGGAAPAFELDGVDGRTGEEATYRLKDYRGNPVVLAFYPADNSPVCTRQLQSYTRDISELEALDATILAISPQSPDEHREFAEANGGFAFALLSDVDKGVARSYGNLGLLDLYRRSIFVLDPGGHVAWIHRSLGPGLRFQSTSRLVQVIGEMNRTR